MSIHCTNKSLLCVAKVYCLQKKPLFVLFDKNVYDTFYDIEPTYDSAAGWLCYLLLPGVQDKICVERFCMKLIFVGGCIQQNSTKRCFG
jgi:hypothetical protein